MRVGIYTRISLDREGDSFSPERQEQLCRQLAAGRGWEVVLVETDRSKSGWKKGVKRPGFDALLRAVDRREIDVVMAYSLVRLGRRAVGLLELLEYLRERGAALALYDLNIDTSTAVGQMFFTFVAGMAQLEAEQTSERVKSYNKVAAESGWLHGGGCRQFGYERSGSVNKAEAEVVREAARRLTEGESLRRVATDLNERGVATTTGRTLVGSNAPPDDHVAPAGRHPGAQRAGAAGGLGAGAESGRAASTDRRPGAAAPEGGRANDGGHTC